MSFNVWMDVKEAGFIAQHLNSEMSMLEWGSGGSTIEFSKRVKSYCSVEHNKDWFEKVGAVISEERLDNIERILSPPGSNGFAYEDDVEYYKTDVGDKFSSNYLNEWSRYSAYINAAAEFKRRFDVILIDGRARRCCAVAASSLLRNGGIIFVHDYFLRPAYQKIIPMYYNLTGGIEDTTQTLAKFEINPIATIRTRGMF